MSSKYKVTLETYWDSPLEDEDGNEVFLSIAGWQENFVQFNDMFTYPKVVSVEEVGNGEI